MRIRIIQKPDLPSIDGVRLSGFLWGGEYEVNATLAAYMIAQGWANSVFFSDQAADEPETDADTPINLRRDFSRRPRFRPA